MTYSHLGQEKLASFGIHNLWHARDLVSRLMRRPESAEVQQSHFSIADRRHATQLRYIVKNSGADEYVIGQCTQPPWED